MKLTFLATALLLLVATTASATSISGPAKVVDGDTLYVGTIKVRLQGIDAPEWNKPEGAFATETLKTAINRSVVHCKLTGEVTYDRMVGICTNHAGQDLAAEVINAGAALDCARYSKGRYRSLEPVGVRSKLKQARYC